MKRLALCVAALAVSAAVLPVAHAQFPGTAGRIAFINVDGEVATMAPDGTGVVVVLGDDADFFQSVAWSPDGTKLAAARLRNSESDIIVANADGTNVTNVTNDGAAYNHTPAWSPDGTKLVFSSRTSGGNTQDQTFDLYTIAPSGTGKTKITSAEVGKIYSSPSWSPDGTKIAAHYAGVIKTMNADGSNVATVSTGAGSDRYPDWSPDGSKIAFASMRNDNGRSGGDIWIVNADGSNEHVVAAQPIRPTPAPTPSPAPGATPVPTLPRTDGPEGDVFPSWSPDGSAIVFGSTGERGEGIWKVNPDGSALTKISTAGLSSVSWQRTSASPSATPVPASSAPAITEVPGSASATSGSVGSAVTLAGDGYAPGAALSVSFESTPVQLKTINADASGAYSTTVAVPAGATAGVHHFVVSGLAGNGTSTRRTLVAYTVLAVSLPAGGTGPGSSLLLVVAALLLAVPVVVRLRPHREAR